MLATRGILGYFIFLAAAFFFIICIRLSALITFCDEDEEPERPFEDEDDDEEELLEAPESGILEVPIRWKTFDCDSRLDEEDFPPLLDL